MPWYESKSWNNHQSGSVENLKCNNPQCKKDIKNETVIYDKPRDRVYCDEDCARIGTAFIPHKSLEDFSQKDLILTQRDHVLEIRKIKHNIT